MDLKVLVLGDSFGLPRSYKNSKEIEVKYEDTYPEQLRLKLKKQFPDEDIVLINRSKRYKTSFDILHEFYEDVYLVQPEYIVVQVGIVDCWPREGIEWAPYPEWKGKSPWVNENEFIQNINKFIDNSLSIQGIKAIIFINIPGTNSASYEKHAGSFEWTIIYNNRLEGVLNYPKSYIADAFGLTGESTVCSDGVHPNASGNEVMAELAFKIIKQVRLAEKVKTSKSKEETEEIVKNIIEISPINSSLLTDIYNILYMRDLYGLICGLYEVNSVNPAGVNKLIYNAARLSKNQRIFNSITLSTDHGQAFSKIIEGNIEKHNLYELKLPSTYVFELTNKCNLRCPMCSHTYMNERDQGFMSGAVFERSLKMIKKYARVIRLYSTGESLLHPDILEFIKEIKNEGIITVLSTNGTLINSDFLQKVALKNAVPDNIQLSIEGWDKETYEYFRKGAKFENIVKNVSLLKEYRDGLRWNARISGHCLVTRNTDCVAYVKLWGKYVDKFNFDAMMYPRFFANKLPLELKDIIINPDFSVMKKGRTCSLPFSEMTIGFDGKVSACCGDFEMKLLMGDIMTQQIDEIWNGEIYKKLRHDQWMGLHEMSICKGCDDPYYLESKEVKDFMREKLKGIDLKKTT